MLVCKDIKTRDITVSYPKYIIIKNSKNYDIKFFISNFLHNSPEEIVYEYKVNNYIVINSSFKIIETNVMLCDMPEYINIYSIETVDLFFQEQTKYTLKEIQNY